MEKLITIPEIILLNTIKTALTYIRTDYNNNLADETKSILYRLLNTQEIQRYKLYDQSKAVFITDVDEPRFLDVNLFFNSTRAHIPTIHITLPSETTVNNTLGIGEGYRDDIFDSTLGTYRNVYNRRFRASYNLVITSDNTNEVVLIYNTMRSILISLINHLNLSGLEKIDLGGRDIQINTTLVPTNIFMRSISLDFEYNVGAVDLFDHKIFNSILFNGTAKLE